MAEESVGDAGANHLGYYTGVFSPDGSGIAAHGFSGALHIWRRDGEGGGSGWVPQHALGGHFGPGGRRAGLQVAARRRSLHGLMITRLHACLQWWMPAGPPTVPAC